jgi:hypothetical protein
MNHLQPLIAFIWCHFRTQMMYPSRGELLQLHRRCGLQHQQVCTVASWPMHWQPEGLHGDEGKRWSIQFFWRKLVGYSKCQVYQWQSPPYHTLPYPTIPNFPKITGEDLVPPATFEIEVQSLAASTSLLTVSSFNGSLHGHLNPGAEHCLHGAPCVGPGL